MTNHQLAHVAIEDHPNRHSAVAISGEVDQSNADTISAQVLEAAQRCRTLTLDLRAVTYLDSQGLRLLQTLANHHRQGNLQLTIVAHPDNVAHRLITITHLHRTIPIIPTPADGTG